ncbi:hypothetical protein [Paenibacillus sp. XY044]|uniref:hypothetical protein n=1 Tax=Paenibacillus sp. XY044 TaxID=2026089 RepID=UPI001C52D04C|nr:hypothetical protein [Paenibacillus sp. XY044]
MYGIGRKNLQEADGNKEKGVLVLEYTYQEFIEDLNMGHEIEFLLDGGRYSISYNNTGWHVTKFGNEEYSTYGNVNELLENAKFNDNSLQEIWHKIKIDSIF